MTWILGWAPIVINIILIPSDPSKIFTLPIAAIAGCINVAVYYSKQKNHYEQGSDEYKYCEKKQKEWTTTAVSSTMYAAKKTKDAVKDVTDVDSWKKF